MTNEWDKGGTTRDERGKEREGGEMREKERGEERREDER